MAGKPTSKRNKPRKKSIATLSPPTLPKKVASPSLPSPLSPSTPLHTMAEDVDMLDASRPSLPRRSPDSRPPTAASPPASTTSTGASRRSSLAALMNPEPLSDHEHSRHEESEVEAESHLVQEESDPEEVEEEDEGTSGDDEEEDDEEDSEAGEEEEEEEPDESILITESHAGPLAAAAAATGAIVRSDSKGGEQPSAVMNPTRDSPASRCISIPILIHPSPSSPSNPVAGSASPGDPGGHLPSVSAPAGPVAGPSKPVSSAKPRSKKPRSPSPSPPPLPPAPPLQTIRLDIRLGGPENYEVDVSKLAKDSGQRPPTPPPRITVNKHPISESEPETDGGKKKKRRVCY